MACVFHVQARFGLGDAALTKQLCDETLAKISNLVPNDLVVILSALAKLEIYNEVLVSKLCAKFLRVPSREFSPQLISATLNALAMLPFEHKDLVNRLCVEGRSRADLFTSRQIVSSLLSLVKLQVHDQAFIDNLCQAAMITSNFPPPVVAQLLIALVGLEVVDAKLVTKLCQSVVASNETVDTQTATLLLESLACLKIDHPLIPTLAKRILAGDPTPKELSIVLDVFTTFGAEPASIDSLCEAVKRKIDEFSSQQCMAISNSLAALGAQNELVSLLFAKALQESTGENALLVLRETVGEISPDKQAVVQTCIKQITERCEELSPENVCLALLELSKLQGKDNARDTLLSKLLQRASSQLDGLDSQDMCVILRGLTSSPHETALIDALCSRALVHAQGDDDELAFLIDMLHSLCIMGRWNEEFYREILLRLKKVDLTTLRPESQGMLRECLDQVARERPTWPALPR